MTVTKNTVVTATYTLELDPTEMALLLRAMNSHIRYADKEFQSTVALRDSITAAL